MFRTVIIAANDMQLRWMQAIALQHPRLRVEHCRDRYPAPFELQQLMHLALPELVFLDLKILDSALAMAAMIREYSPRTAIIALGDELHPRMLETAGIAVTVSSDRAPDEFGQAVNAALHAMRPIRHKALFCFLPSKAGSGCSTVAINTAIALGAMNRKILVMEADLRSGTMEIALNASGRGSIQSLLQCDEALDQLRWQQVTERLHNVDWLFSSRKAQGRLPEWTDYYELLDFAAPRYDGIVVDLPELINPATAEVVRTSTQIFIVCTQEVLSLKLAEQRREELDDWGVPSDSVRILVNRWHPREFSRQDVETIVKQPIMTTFPNDYPSCRSAIMKGAPVSSDSKLGRAFIDFAKQLDRPDGSEPKGRFARLLSSIAGR